MVVPRATGRPRLGADRRRSDACEAALLELAPAAPPAGGRAAAAARRPRLHDGASTVATGTPRQLPSRWRSSRSASGRRARAAGLQVHGERVSPSRGRARRSTWLAGEGAWDRSACGYVPEAPHVDARRRAPVPEAKPLKGARVRVRHDAEASARGGCSSRGRSCRRRGARQPRVRREGAATTVIAPAAGRPSRCRGRGPAPRRRIRTGPVERLGTQPAQPKPPSPSCPTLAPRIDAPAARGASDASRRGVAAAVTSSASLGARAGALGDLRGGVLESWARRRYWRVSTRPSRCEQRCRAGAARARSEQLRRARARAPRSRRSGRVQLTPDAVALPGHGCA